MTAGEQKNRRTGEQRKCGQNSRKIAKTVPVQDAIKRENAPHLTKGEVHFLCVLVFIPIPCRSSTVHEPRHTDRHKRDRRRRGEEDAEKGVHLIAVAENKDAIRGNDPGSNKVHGADGDEREKPHDPPPACMQKDRLEEVESDRDGGDEKLNTHGGLPCGIYFSNGCISLSGTR